MQNENDNINIRILNSKQMVSDIDQLQIITIHSAIEMET
jgi:hypothetical protein